MKTISSIYRKTKDLFYKDYNDIEYVKLESQGFEDYINGLQKENEDLKHRNINLEKAFNDISSQNEKLESLYDKLTQENSNMDKHINELETDLQDYYKIQDKQQEQLEDAMLYGEDNPYYLEKYHPKLYEEILKNKDLEEENLYLKNYNKLLEGSNFNLHLKQTVLENRIEELEQQQEINDILETDKPLDDGNFKNKDDKLVNIIGKVADERDTYKNVISIMCDKFDIKHDEVLNIVDDLSQNKGQQIERV